PALGGPSDNDCARDGYRDISGKRDAGGGDESVPVRLLYRHPARVHLLAPDDPALPLADFRPPARPHRHPGRGPRGQISRADRAHAGRNLRGYSRASQPSAPGPAHALSRHPDLLQRADGGARTACPLPGRSGRRAPARVGDQPPGAERARLHSNPQGRAHDCRPRRRRSDPGPACQRGDPVSLARPRRAMNRRGLRSPACLYGLFFRYISMDRPAARRRGGLVMATGSLTEFRTAHAQAIARFYRRGRCVELGLDEAELAAALYASARAWDADAEPAAIDQYLEALRAEDFALARACARGNERAWERFIAAYRPGLYAAARALTHDEARAGELADSLWAELYG